MGKISVTIITFNEERNIRRCLESVRWADEIVVVDSFSTDKTVEICREYTEHVIQHEWLGYVQQKNYAVDCATYDWIFSLDADEEISPELQSAILGMWKRGFSYDGYKVARKVYYLGRWIRHGGWYPDYKIRLFHRAKGRWGGIDLHEKVILNGTCGKLKGDLFHYTYENITVHIRKMNSYTTISAQKLYKKGRKPSLLNIFFNPPVKFIKTYFIKAGFLDGKAGFFISIIGSFYVFMKYLKLWELYQFNPDKPEE